MAKSWSPACHPSIILIYKEKVCVFRVLVTKVTTISYINVFLPSVRTIDRLFLSSDLPQSKLYKSLSPLVTFSHLCSHISGLSGDQLGDQLGDKVTNFCHPIKNRPKAVSVQAWFGPVGMSVNPLRFHRCQIRHAMRARGIVLKVPRVYLCFPSAHVTCQPQASR